MSNLAIVIGVSEYGGEANLPACKNDASIIHRILIDSKKFDSILNIDGYVSGRDIKSKISEFIRDYENNDVEEIFFYFSGHGTRIGEEFWYVTSDFDNTNPHTTGLSNSELDEILKSLSPTLTAKVVDACFAGTEYIKSWHNISNIFDKSLHKNNFDKVYFLFSSTRDETSIAFRDISLFTKSFVKAIFSFEKGNIRYQDLVSFITDDLSSPRFHQNPYFVTQANQTEIFIDVNKIDIPNIKSDFPYFTNENNTEVTSNSVDLPLVARVREANKYYCSKDEVDSILSHLDDIANNFEFSEDVSELFIIEINNSNELYKIPDRRKISEWIKEGDDNYFVKLIYVKEERERTVHDFGVIIGKGRKEKYFVDVVSDYSPTYLESNNVKIINFFPKFEFLPKYDIFVTYIISKNKITFFSKFERYKDLNWSTSELESNNSWRVDTKTLKPEESLYELFNHLLQVLNSYIINDIESLVS
ncbi:caspase family protein [Psychrobacter sp. KCTC 72983]|uniref:caspase family protein n=1 Tax=Psychrobacter sp. KCTC 72983 TaxID=2733866 RepID=UPI0016447E07|nr:caspase family protein [Psychrobacter sp. KCTC 72983]